MKSQGWVLLASVLMSAAALGSAQDKAPETQPTPSPSATPSRRGGPATVAKPPQRQRVTGTLQAFDAEAATVTFTDESGKTLTWPVEARLAENARSYAEQLLQALKPGDRVRITYVVQAGQGPRVYDVRPVVAQGPGSDGDQ